MSTLNTDFNVSPYYDDYDGDKKFHRVLFKPAVALQARELTQLQTILQSQVSRFGNNIYKEGTIIEGCQIKLDGDYDYIKITDLQTDGQPVAPSTYLNYYAKGATSNVVAAANTEAEIRAAVFANIALATGNSGSTTTGISSATADLNTIATTNTLALRIMGVQDDPDNADFTAAGIPLIVRINNHFNAPTGSIAAGTVSTTGV